MCQNALRGKQCPELLGQEAAYMAMSTCLPSGKSQKVHEALVTCDVERALQQKTVHKPCMIAHRIDDPAEVLAPWSLTHAMISGLFPTHWSWNAPTITAAPSYFTQAILKLPLNCPCRPCSFPRGDPKWVGEFCGKVAG